MGWKQVSALAKTYTVSSCVFYSNCITEFFLLKLFISLPFWIATKISLHPLYNLFFIKIECIFMHNSPLAPYHECILEILHPRSFSDCWWTCVTAALLLDATGACFSDRLLPSSLFGLAREPLPASLCLSRSLKVSLIKPSSAVGWKVWSASFSWKVLRLKEERSFLGCVLKRTPIVCHKKKKKNPS